MARVTRAAGADEVASDGDGRGGARMSAQPGRGEGQLRALPGGQGEERCPR